MRLQSHDNRMERAMLGNPIALGSNPGSALMNPWADYLTPFDLVISSIKWE